MRFFGWILWIVGCLFSTAYAPWKWTLTSIYGSKTTSAGYAWLLNPPQSHLDSAGIIWMPHIDKGRWAIQIIITLALIGVSIIIFGRKNKGGV